MGMDMGQAFQLQVPPGRIIGVILPHGSLNVDGVSAVPFDEVGIIAIDDSQEINDRIPGNRMELPAKGRRPTDDFPRHIVQIGRTIRKKGFHLWGSSIHLADPSADYFFIYLYNII
jgi:hypothetical protein